MNENIDIMKYEFLDSLKSLSFVQAIYLYGSRARGENQSTSDIDLAIKYTKDKSGNNYKKISDIISNADTLLKVDWIDIEEHSDSELLKRIQQYWQPIYKSKSGMDISIEIKKLDDALNSFNRSLQVSIKQDEYVLDASIKRFEFSYEITWKTLKKALFLLDGIDVAHPRQVFEEAYSGKWIDDESIWLEMIKDRNQTSHAYNESKALDIYNNLQPYYHAMNELLSQIKSRLSSSTGHNYDGDAA